MKRFTSLTLLTVFLIGTAFSAVKVYPKGKMKQKIEPNMEDRVVLSQGSMPIIMPEENRNSYNWALVDSSSNGYGMVAANTRPLFVDVDEGNWFTCYRQYAGLNTTHGQIGASFSDDEGESWAQYINLNYNGNPPWGGGGVGGTGVAQGRYPSAVGTPDQPVAIWNEYTGADLFGVGSYGGRPYYAYDEFGWDGGSFSYPANIDLLWETEGKDLWVGSPSISYNEDEDMYVVNVVYNDWTRGDRYLFHSEAYEDGYIVFGEEQLIIDEVNDLVGGDDTGSYNTSPYLSCNPEGICMVGLVGYFLGADTETSNISNDHTAIFKMSDDHGLSWYGCPNGQASDGCAPSTDGDGYFFIPHSVFEDVLATQFPEGGYQDECDGSFNPYSEMYTWYEDDLKVDRDGNPHIIMQMAPCNAEGSCWFEENAGIYHFTADKDELGSASAWSWSFVMSSEPTWNMDDLTGDTYIWNNSSSLAFSAEDTDVVYVVTGMAEPGEPREGFADDYADPCYLYTMADFPSWSEEIFVIKSVDGGVSWWNPMNATQTPDETGGTCPGGLPKCDPAETYPHAAQFGTDNQVYVQYQTPNWAFNEIGDLLGADFMNHVVIGTVTVDDGSSLDAYPGEWLGGDPTPPCNDPGDINGDSIINIIDIVTMVNHIMGSALLDDTCAADLNEDGIVNIIDIVNVVNIIMGGRTSHVDATRANIELSDHSISIYSNGYIGGIDMTVEFSGNDLVLDLVSGSEVLVSEYIVNNDNTARILVASGTNVEKVVNDVLSGSITSIKDVTLVTTDNDGYGEVDNVSIEAPDSFSVQPAYPNPFNPSTNLSLVLNTKSDISVKVYNVVGQLVDVIAEGSYTPNTYNWTWNADNLSSGVYLVRTQVGSKVNTQKLMLLK